MTRSHKREHGRILSVDEETLGTTLAADAAAGATTLTVDDAAEFEDDGSGGWLSINDQVIQYDTVDDDAGTIHLLTALAAAADDGDPVYVWSKLYDTAATVKTALVMVDGEDENTDPIHATLADAIQDLPEGLRGDAGESCTLLRVSEDEWEVTAIGGRPPKSRGRRWWEDSLTASSDGAQTMTLTYLPVDRSEFLFCNGLFWQSSEWSRSDRTVTIPDPSAIIAFGDTFTMRYQYEPVLTPASASEPGFVSGSTGTAATGQTIDLTIPSTTMAGDTMFIVSGRSASGSGGHVADPAGWTVVGKVQSSSDDFALLWRKTASAGDAGTTVRLQSSDWSNLTGGAGAALVVYRGTVKSVSAMSSLGNSQAGSSPQANVATGDLTVGIFALSGTGAIGYANADLGSVTRQAATGQKGAALVVDKVVSAAGQQATNGGWAPADAYAWTVVISS